VKPLTSCVLTLGLCAAGCAFASADVAQKLFAGKSLPLADQQAIAAQLPLKLQGGILTDTVCDQEAVATVEVRDLNGDEKPEVMVLAGNACASGMAGQTLTLFIKSAGGQWVKQINVPAGAYKILPSKHAGWSEIEIGVPGSCIPIWGMKGGSYDLVRQTGDCRRR
jgi:hypothetical protein